MKELKAYYCQVRSWLPCGGKIKKQLMANIRATIDEYLAENPKADFSALQAHFGTPQQIAIAFVDEMETAELLDALRTRRKIVKILLYAVLAFIIIWFVAVFTLWIVGMFNELGYGVATPPIVE